MLFAGTNDGVFLSTDNGASWSLRSTGLTDKRVHSIAIGASRIFAGSNDGAFISSDNGTTWRAINTALANPPVTGFIQADYLMLAGTKRGVFQSTDNGSKWSLRSVEGSPQILSFVESNTSPKYLYGATGWQGIVARSNDDGGHWKNIFPFELYGVFALAVS
jgi:photosystem II stability/assembly factor-like uncharacterized protein